MRVLVTEYLIKKIGKVAEPASKKQKVSIGNFTKYITPVLRDEEIRGCTLVPAYCLVVDSPKKIQPILNTLNSPTSSFQLNSFNYLRRLKKISLVDDTATKEFKEITFYYILVGDKNTKLEGLKELIESFDAKLIEVDVPEYPPLTDEQNEIWRTHWPTITQTMVPSTPPSDIFSEEQLFKIKDMIRLSQSEAAEAVRNGHHPVGCVIFDKNWNILTSSHDTSCKFYLQYFTQGSIANHILEHATINCINNVSQIHKNGTSDYLCTGYHFLITEEPCIMCSMALLHSRIATVFYLDIPNKYEGHGGLGSKYKIHCDKKLNHNFNVYKICQ